MRKFPSFFAVLLAVVAIPATASAAPVRYAKCTASSPAAAPGKAYGFTYEKFSLWSDKWPIYLTGCSWIRLPSAAISTTSINFQMRFDGRWVDLGCRDRSQTTLVKANGMTTSSQRVDIQRSCALRQFSAGHQLRLVVTYQVAGTSPLPQMMRVITPIKRGDLQPHEH